MVKWTKQAKSPVSSLSKMLFVLFSLFLVHFFSYLLRPGNCFSFFFYFLRVDPLFSWEHVCSSGSNTSTTQRPCSFSPIWPWHCVPPCPIVPTPHCNSRYPCAFVFEKVSQILNVFFFFLSTSHNNASSVPFSRSVVFNSLFIGRTDAEAETPIL